VRTAQRDSFSSSRVAFLAVEHCAECGRTARRGRDPWPTHPRRVVTYVLLMTALELRDPVALIILVEPGDFPFHERTSSVGHSEIIGESAIGGAFPRWLQRFPRSH